MIKCDMDFVLYPLDVQKCAVDFSSCKFGRRFQHPFGSFLSALMNLQYFKRDVLRIGKHIQFNSARVSSPRYRYIPVHHKPCHQSNMSRIRSWNISFNFVTPLLHLYLNQLTLSFAFVFRRC